MATAKQKKARIKKIPTIKCPVDLPQAGLKVTIENKLYEVMNSNTVKNKDGKIFKVI